MKTVIGERLRRARESAGFRTAKEFSDTHGIPQSTYVLHENGARGLKPEIAGKYARLLGVSAAWLLTGEGSSLRAAPAARAGGPAAHAAKMPHEDVMVDRNSRRQGEPYSTIIPIQLARRDLPVLGTAQGGQNGTLIIPVEQRPVDYAFRPPQLEGVTDAFAVFAREDSMHPMYRNGQVLLIHPHLPIRPGDGILIIKKDDHALIKCLARRTQSEVRVRQFNPDREFVIAVAEIRAIYRVVGAIDPF